ncbi:hypothetical protein [Micromonospora auratinigra]|uniref:Uncharacterized protein n=1 Tax=Micromonospora auratinigra TaxID=261654 RepID=A0A1A8Z4J9_9ACTN|nr:hypothetical protein [Micromonospora auratinigra]SBT38775.1 hypothetical protein GA0070611_0670 [Micromonospora auratinigra]
MDDLTETVDADLDLELDESVELDAVEKGIAINHNEILVVS